MVQISLALKEDEPHGHWAVEELVRINRDGMRLLYPLEQISILIHQQGRTTPTGVHVEMGPHLLGCIGQFLEIVHIARLGGACDPHDGNNLCLFSPFPLFQGFHLPVEPPHVHAVLIVHRNVQDVLLSHPEHIRRLLNGVMPSG